VAMTIAEANDLAKMLEVLAGNGVRHEQDPDRITELLTGVVTRLNERAGKPLQLRILDPEAVTRAARQLADLAYRATTG